MVNLVNSSIFSAIQYRTIKFDVIFVYWSSGTSNEETSEILATLDSWIIDRPTAIMGDVNMHYTEDCKLNKFLQGKGFSQLIKEATFDTGSLIDHIYANEDLKKLSITTEQCSAYFTDHDIISLYIAK